MKITKLPFSWYTKKKMVLAFEFATVLADTASQLGIPMTREIVVEAETLLEKELGPCTPSQFACNMNVYVLAILKPKD